MKIEELISGKKINEDINIEWASIPASAFKKFMEDGYVYIKPYKSDKTFSLWGKTCTGCFTEKQIKKKA